MKVCIGFHRRVFGTGSNGISEPWQALGLDPRTAVQAPWPIVRTFAAGPAISRESALLAHDTITGGGAVAPHSGSQPTAGRLGMSKRGFVRGSA